MPPDILVAGYVVGALFMVVSVTPSGVGVVEGAMTLTFASLGVPVATAVAATLLFRLFTIWLPLLAGFATVRRLRPGAAQTGVR
ncbi:MAG: flippase-like domain-containing protein [Armatimonadetes bacterium]|nr:flippase-like domain-containing protein [Armatimonadota bacterium]